MDNIIVPGLTTGQINDYVTEFNEAHAAEGVNAALQVDQAGNKALVITTANGKSLTLTLTDAPDIDPADLTPDELDEALNDFSAKIEDFAKELKSGDKQKSPSTNVLCDIFALILMLLKVSQTQRDTMSAIRQQGHAAVQANIKAQADSIRSQAEQAFSLSLASAIVSSVMTSASIGMAIAGAVNQIKAIKTSNISGAQNDLKTSEAQLKNITAAFGKGEPVEGMETSKFTPGLMAELGLPDQGSPEANEAFFKQAYMPETAKAEVAEQQAKAEMEAARTKSQTADSVELQKANALEAAKAKEAATEAKGKLDDFLGNYDDKDKAKAYFEDGYKQMVDGEVDMTKTPDEIIQQAKDKQIIKEPVKDSDIEEFKKYLTLRQDSDAADAKLQSFGLEPDQIPSVAEANEAYLKAQNDAVEAKAALDKAEAKWTVKAAEVQVAQEKDAKNLDNLAKEAAKDVDQKAKLPVKGENGADIRVTPEQIRAAKEIAKKVEAVQDKEATTTILKGLQMKVDTARDKLGQVAHIMNNSKNAQLSKMFDNLINVSGQLSSTISKFLDTYRDRNAGISEADRKLLEAEIDKGRALIEDADDLRQAAQSQLSSFIQSMMAILQMENQTNLQMIRG